MTYATAIILVGGTPDPQGSETAPGGIRDATELALTPVAGRPLLGRILEHLAAQGITEAILAVDSPDERVEDVFGHKHAGISLRYSRDERPNGSGAALAHALQEHNSREPVWVVDGPAYFACDLLALALVHEANTADVTMALTQRADAAGLSAVRLARKSNAGGALVDAIYPGTGGVEGLVSTGYHLFNPAAFQRFDLPLAFSLEGGFLAEHLEDLRLIGAPTPGAFFDLRHPSEAARAEAHFAG